MPLSPYSGYLALVFLVGVIALMFFDKVQGPWMLGAAVIGIPALIGGWFLVRDRVLAAANDSGPSQAGSSTS
jgi:L-asparagine permease